MSGFFTVVDDGKWKCSTCSCRWEQTVVQCKACEAYKPGLSEEDVERLKAEERRKRQADIDKFRTPTSGTPGGGFSFGAASTASTGLFGPSCRGFSFGAASGAATAPGLFGSGTGGAPGSSAPTIFGFGAGAAATTAPTVFGFASAASSGGGAPMATTGLFGQATPAAPAGGAPTAFSFGAPAAAASVGSPGASGFGFGSAPSSAASGPTVFGFGAGRVTAGAPADAGPAAEAAKLKQLSKLPHFAEDASRVLLGDIFVHGSGECDQLGLGEDVQTKQKPARIRELVDQRVFDIAVGALHVLCSTSDGRLFSWGCNDDGALGRTQGAESLPKLVPVAAAVRRVAAGDNHSCALDSLGRVWLWGTYKDSNGHIGIALKRKRDEVELKSSEPAVVLDGCTDIASGANHTLALTKEKRVFSWGSNACGQLGLESGAGCGLDEQVTDVSSFGAGGPTLRKRAGGGVELDGQLVVRIVEASGTERSAMGLTVDQVQSALSAGARSLITEVPERDVPKPERQKLLVPQEMRATVLGDAKVAGIFASSECSFLTCDKGGVYGCGLNGDGQVGLGFPSMAVKTPRRLPGLASPSWIGGGLHYSAALVGEEVFTWGKAEECGHGFGEAEKPIMEPARVKGLPGIRRLRCGEHHTLACSKAGDVFVWGCGLTHQLGNRPRSFRDTSDVDEDPTDELKPYCISSKQLDQRFVLLADGGAQHSVELAWTGAGAVALSEAPDLGKGSPEEETMAVDKAPAGAPAEAAGEPASKKSRTEAAGPSEASAEVPTEPVVGGFANLLAAMDDGKWKCGTCSLRWDAKLIQCGACEAWKPGLSEAEVAAIEKEKKQKRDQAVALFRSAPASDKSSSGFSFPGASAAPASTTFGFGNAGAASGGGTGTTFGFVAGSPSAGGGGGGGGTAFGFGSAGVAPASGSGGGPVFGFGAAAGGGGGAASGGSATTFGFGGANSPAASSGTSFGFGAPAAAPTFGFGGANSPAAGSGTVFGFGSAGAAPTVAAGSTPFGFGAAAAAGAGGGFGAATSVGASAPALTFGCGSGAVQAPLAAAPLFGAAGASAAVHVQTQELSAKKRPEASPAKQPICEVLVHGSGECDQLGLGDDMRERKKPFVIKMLSGSKVTDLSAGALHVVCVTASGGLFSWGCNDDYALGRDSKEDADCEPRPVPMPQGVQIARVSCGDNHTCALGLDGRVWLWGAYKDSNGHIMSAKKQAVVLEGCSQIASGANHTLALERGGRRVFAWGSNATGQLGLASGKGCGFDEVEVPAADVDPGRLTARVGGGSEYDGKHVVRIRAAGVQRSAAGRKPEQVKQDLLAAKDSVLILEVPERDVPKEEKKELLTPQEVFLGDITGSIRGVHASAEGTFLSAPSGVFGCGLNGDGQVGLGYASMAVRTPKRLLEAVADATWVGGGLHFSAALVKDRVFTWGKAEECGLGLGQDAPVVLEPRAVDGLPPVRALRCGGSHTLACSEGGDVYVWGCGLTYQLGNRPRNYKDRSDGDEDPTDELKPYCISSKQLESRYVLLADGGAQHSVELAWTGEYADMLVVEGEAVETDASASAKRPLELGADAAAPPAKKQAVEVLEAEAAEPPAGIDTAAACARVRALAASAEQAAARREAQEAAARRLEARFATRAEAEVSQYFSGPLLADCAPDVGEKAQVEKLQQASGADLRVIWPAKEAANLGS